MENKCPYCGATLEVWSDLGNNGTYRVMCHRCKIASGLCSSKKDEDNWVRMHEEIKQHRDEEGNRDWPW